MNPTLKEILDTKKIIAPDGEILELANEISPKEGELIQRLILDLKPAHSLEVGLAYGVSSLYICEALSQQEKANHIIIDPYQAKDWKNIGLNYLKKAGYDKMIDFREELSWKTLADLQCENHQLDFAFIDGNHNYDDVFIDFCFISRLLRPGGIVVFDDAHFPAVRKVILYILSTLPYKMIDSTGPKLTSSWKQNLVSSFVRTFPSTSKKLFKPEVLNPRLNLGRYSSCIAFLKESNEWEYERFSDF